MRRMPEGLISDIRAQADIVDLVSKYMTLTKKGNNYWGVCPFHEDHDPSMSVASDKQIYKCFVCGAGGNVFTFVQNFEKISFIEAVIKVANSIGVDVSGYQTSVTKVKDPHKEMLYEAMKQAGDFVSYQLATPKGEKALKLLHERQYDQDLIEKFEIGVVYDQNQLYNFLHAKGFYDKVLVEADLVRMMDGEVRDVFYNRIMFPIHDKYGRVIAFSARALEKDSKVKYINTSQTPLYTKGDIVYNMHRAKDAAREDNFLVVTEGVTDAIAFSKAGIDSVVSLLGVACTDQQVSLLRECSKTIVLAFDGDKAGFEASYHIGRKLQEKGLSVFVWYNDTGLDPDDALRQFGAKTVRKGLEHRIHWYDFVLNYAVGQYGTESFENRKRIAEFVMNELRNADDLEKSHYLTKLANKTNFEISVLRQQMGVKEGVIEGRKAYIHKTQVPKANSYGVSMHEKNILSLMLHSKQAAHIYRDKLGFMTSDLANDLALILLDLYRQSNTISGADILSMDLQDTMKDFAIEIQSGDYLSEFSEAILNEHIEAVKEYLIELGIEDLHKKHRESLELDKSIRLLEEAILKKRKHNHKEGDK